jgi:hypothetical protein
MRLWLAFYINLIPISSFVTEIKAFNKLLRFALASKSLSVLTSFKCRKSSVWIPKAFIFLGVLFGYIVGIQLIRFVVWTNS